MFHQGVQVPTAFGHKANVLIKLGKMSLKLIIARGGAKCPEVKF